jgi:hypothetical protein
LNDSANTAAIGHLRQQRAPESRIEAGHVGEHHQQREPAIIASARPRRRSAAGARFDAATAALLTAQPLLASLDYPPRFALRG